MKDRWRSRMLAREAIKNVFDLGSRLAPVLVFAIVASVVIVTFAAYEGNLLRHQLAEEGAKGRNVLEIDAADPKQSVKITRASCEALAKVPGVVRAGQIVPDGTHDFPQIGADIPVVGASSQLFPALRQTDVLIGSELRKQTHQFELLVPGGFGTAVTDSPEPAGLEVDSDIVVHLMPGLSAADNCYVVLDQFTNAGDLGLELAARLSVTGGPVGVTHFFVDSSDPLTNYLNRPTRFLPILIGVFGGLVAGILNRLRSGELAAYRLSGTTARSLWLLLLFEQVLLAGVFLTFALPSIVILQRYFYSSWGESMYVASTAMIWLITANIVAIDVPAKAPTSLARNR